MVIRGNIAGMGRAHWQEENSRRNILCRQHHSVLFVAEANLPIETTPEYLVFKQFAFINGQTRSTVPDYTTLCRRQKSLPIEIEDRLSRGENLVTGIDSTGLKVYGKGEWKISKHGWSKRRTWRKLHICIDLNAQMILSVKLTGNDEDGASVGARMLKDKTSGIESFRGGGAYDKFKFRKAWRNDVLQIIPPPSNVVVQKGKKEKPLPDYLIQRNEAVDYRNKHGLKSWKEQEDYLKRSLNEVVMYRYKIFSERSWMHGSYKAA